MRLTVLGHAHQREQMVVGQAGDPTFRVRRDLGEVSVDVGLGRSNAVSAGRRFPESLDGILLHNVAGDLATVFALGSAQARPDADTMKLLNDAERVLLALDTDRAGYTSWLWWRQHFNKAVRWPVINGKDPGEAYKNGVDLRTWIMAGLINNASL